MNLNIEDYRKKLLGCWLGKNIGGTLGAPIECRRGIFDFTFYTQKLSGDPMPNDDFDLQLVWLNAVEKYGRKTNASILGEYWHSYVVPNWAEYGAGKNNMRAGILPPLSGYVNNLYRDSNGAWIRAEIWACLAPGHPEIAVQYALEDASVDHSAEGIYGEIFIAAIESAAFVESDKWKLIDIGLSYIPADCGVTLGVKTIMQAYKDGLTWQEARKKILQTVPGSFGLLATGQVLTETDIPAGPMGYDAPSNIGITMLGWLYGEDNFGKTICLAANCGEDCDCTCGSLGSIFGIIHGADGIPQVWKDPIGDRIVTLCINRGDQGLNVPATVQDLTERILRLAPLFLGPDICDTVHSANGYTLKMLEGADLYSHPVTINTWEKRSFSEALARTPFTTAHESTILDAFLDYGKEPYIQENTPRHVKLTLRNNLFIQQWINIQWHAPEGWQITPSKEISASLEQYHCNIGKLELEFIITPIAMNRPRYDLVIDISSVGRHTKCLVPVVLFNKGIAS